MITFECERGLRFVAFVPFLQRTRVFGGVDALRVVNDQLLDESFADDLHRLAAVEFLAVSVPRDLRALLAHLAREGDGVAQGAGHVLQRGDELVRQRCGRENVGLNGS